MKLNSVHFVISDMGITDRKERERNSMKALILDAAMKLYLDHGIENVTIRNIAEKIEFSPATIYLYFKDKDQIFFQLYNIAFGKFFSEQVKLGHISDPMERLNKAGHHYIQWALANPKLYDLMFILEIPMDVIAEEDCDDIGMRSFDVLKRNVNECILAGKLSVTNPDLASMMYWNMLHGIVSLLIKKRVLYPPEVMTAMNDGMLDTFNQMMRN